MSINTNTQILAFTSAFALLITSPITVLAADSSSFTLYDGVSDIVDVSPLGSNSFSLDESGETWIAYPLTGNNFQIVTAPPAQSSSVSTSSSSSSSSDQETVGGSGGHRGHGTNTNQPSPTTPTKPSAPDPKPSIPKLPAQVIDIPEPRIDPMPGVDFMPSEPGFEAPVYSTDDKRQERITSRPHFFDFTEEEQDMCFCSQVLPAAPHVSLAQTPVVSTLMLIVAFILGYVARLSRPGYAALSKKVTKSKKK